MFCMDQKRESHHRRSIRLPDYDYSQPGAYFVTIVTYQHACILGRMVASNMQLSAIGMIVETTWHEIPDHFPHIHNDHFVIMPNHIHGIIIIEHPPVGARHASPRARWTYQPSMVKFYGTSVDLKEKTYHLCLN